MVGMVLISSFLEDKYLKYNGHSGFKKTTVYHHFKIMI